jgi:endonuclease/exonuclease/phosphatase (EEP) superfamily protein YafD
MWQSVLAYAGAFSLCTAAAALAVRWIPVVNRSLLALAAGAPYLSIGAPVGAVLAGAARNWPLTVVAIAVTAAAAVVQLPLFRRVKAPSGTALRFLSANLRYGRADAETVVRYAEEGADIVALQELTPAALARLAAAGLDRTFPHQALREMDEPGGVGLWSRYPISDVRVDDGFWLGMLAADVHLPEAPAPTRVLTVHLSAPWPDPLQGWRDDLARLAGTLLTAAQASTGPVLLAGDLNATTDMREFRRLLRQGYHDAGMQAGAGVVRTHPSDIVTPPVFAVDHILTRGYVATSLQTLQVPGSDHRALLVQLVAG